VLLPSIRPHLSAVGQMVRFDHFSYPRTGTERVTGFCTDEERQLCPLSQRLTDHLRRHRRLAETTPSATRSRPVWAGPKSRQRQQIKEIAPSRPQDRKLTA
jgi:hypothetical protein